MSQLKHKAAIVIVSAISAAGLALSLIIVGCRPQPSPDLSFETIEQVNSVISQQSGSQPGLLIITDSEDVKEASPFVTDEAKAALSQLDFTTHFAIHAFWGRQPFIHQYFRIERITRQDREVTLWAEALPDLLVEKSTVTWPYHLIKVRKEGDWGAVFTFTLYFAEQSQQEPLSVSCYIPSPASTRLLIPEPRTPVGTPPTATPFLGEIRTPAAYSPTPSPTPMPVTDLAQGLPDKDKVVYIIRRSDGRYEQYLLPFNVSGDEEIRQLLNLGPQDVIAGVYALVPLPPSTPVLTKPEAITGTSFPFVTPLPTPM
jgi:hypothetical protein